MTSPAGAASSWSWKVQASYPAPAHLESVACTSISDCIAVGDDGTIVATTDGGSTWTAQSPPSGTASLSASRAPRPSTASPSVQAAPSSRRATAGPHGRAEPLRSRRPSSSASRAPRRRTASRWGTGRSCDMARPHRGHHTTADGGVTWTDRTVPTMPRTSTRSRAPRPPTASPSACSPSSPPPTAEQRGPRRRRRAASSRRRRLVRLGVRLRRRGRLLGPHPGVVLTTTNGGATWTSQTAPSGANTLWGVSCPRPPTA